MFIAKAEDSDARQADGMMGQGGLAFTDGAADPLFGMVSMPQDVESWQDVHKRGNASKQGTQNEDEMANLLLPVHHHGHGDFSHGLGDLMPLAADEEMPNIFDSLEPSGILEALDPNPQRFWGGELQDGQGGKSAPPGSLGQAEPTLDALSAPQIDCLPLGLFPDGGAVEPVQDGPLPGPEALSQPFLPAHQRPPSGNPGRLDHALADPGFPPNFLGPGLESLSDEASPLMDHPTPASAQLMLVQDLNMVFPSQKIEQGIPVMGLHDFGVYMPPFGHRVEHDVVGWGHHGAGGGLLQEGGLQAMGDPVAGPAMGGAHVAGPSDIGRDAISDPGRSTIDPSSNVESRDLCRGSLIRCHIPPHEAGGLSECDSGGEVQQPLRFQQDRWQHHQQQAAARQDCGRRSGPRPGVMILGRDTIGWRQRPDGGEPIGVFVPESMSAKDAGTLAAKMASGLRWSNGPEDDFGSIVEKFDCPGEDEEEEEDGDPRSAAIRGAELANEVYNKVTAQRGGTQGRHGGLRSSGDGTSSGGGGTGQSKPHHGGRAHLKGSRSRDCKRAFFDRPMRCVGPASDTPSPCRGAHKRKTGSDSTANHGSRISSQTGLRSCSMHGPSRGSGRDACQLVRGIEVNGAVDADGKRGSPRALGATAPARCPSSGPSSAAHSQGPPQRPPKCPSAACAHRRANSWGGPDGSSNEGGPFASDSERGSAVVGQGVQGRYVIRPHGARKKREITHDMLRRVFNSPIDKAATALGIGVTVLKKSCRTYGITRWPFRKLSSINKLRTSLINTQDAVGPVQDVFSDARDDEKNREENITTVVSKLERLAHEITQDPSAEMPEDIKKLRQQHFKQEYKMRQSSKRQQHPG